MALRERGFVALERGRPRRALEYLDRASGLTSSIKTRAIAHSLRARLGERRPAQAMLDSITSGSETRIDAPYRSSLVEAILRLGLSDADGALEAIREAFDERDPAVVYLSRQAMYEPLRQDDRFIELLESAQLASP